MQAAEYRKHWMHRKVWNRLTRPQHQSRLKWCASECVGETFADIGCACGHSTAIMEKAKAGKWTGIDFDPEIIRQALIFFPDRIFYPLGKVSDLHSLGKFDSVVCSEVIEHVPDDRELVAQLWGIADKKMILTTPNRFVDDPGHLRVYGMKKLQRIFNTDALGQDAIIKIESVGRFWHITVERREA